MLSNKDVEARLKKWPTYIHQTVRPAPEIMIDRCLALTFTHLTAPLTTPIPTFDGLTFDMVGESMFGRAMTVRARFGLANYNAVEIGMLLNVHYLVVLCFLERYGMDWGPKMNVKLLRRLRGKHTLFHYPHDEMWHTPETFHHVYGTPVKQVIACLEAEQDPPCLRTSDTARKMYFKELAEHGAVRDGFGLASNYLRMPLYRELHIKRSLPEKRVKASEGESKETV